MTTDIIAVDDDLLARLAASGPLGHAPVQAMAVELQGYRALHAGDAPLLDRIARLVAKLRDLTLDLEREHLYGWAQETRDMTDDLDRIADDIEGATP